MLCPNELGCTYSRYMIPRTNGEVDEYEMFDGTFLKGDLCNFKVTNPVGSDMNDVMYLRLEYVARAKAVLIKGESLANPIAMYTLDKGQDYTALKDINFYLLFIATQESSGDFVFKIWFQGTSGSGEKIPTEVTYEKDPRNPDKNDPETTEEEDPEPDTVEEDPEPDTVEETESDTEEEPETPNKNTGNVDDSDVEKIGDIDSSDEDVPEVFPDDKKNEDPVITDDETDKKEEDSPTG